MGEFSQLRSILRSYGSCLVAYSGGVDSVLLAKVAHDELGGRMLAAIADSPSLPRRELAEARELAERLGFPLEILSTGEFADPDYANNPPNRCYYCKHELFSQLVPLARERGLAVIAYGENASDLGDHRPGALAATQFAIRAPLKEAGLTKAQIRSYSAQLGLPTADKPQMACLASRIPYGQIVTAEKTGMIERAEQVLRGMGFYDVRVRHHQEGPRASVEVGVDELPRLRAQETWPAIEASLRGIGYAQVDRDELGYRRGHWNAGQPR